MTLCQMPTCPINTSENSENPAVPYCSSPIHCPVEIPTFSEPESDSTTYSSDDEPLYCGPRIGTNEFTTALKEVFTTHGVTARLSIDVLNLFKKALPPDANVPSHYALNKSSLEACNAYIVNEVNGTDFNFLVFNIAEQLGRVVGGNWPELWNASRVEVIT